jgi:Ribonuclease G/E
VTRRLYIDDAPGEQRGVVTLDGRPERLLLARRDDLPGQVLGSRSIARVRTVDRTLASAFLDLGEGPDAILPLTGEARGLAEGAAIVVEIAAEARRGKGAVARWISQGEGAPRPLAPAPDLATRLRAVAPGQTIVGGAEARDVADAAEDAVLALEHPLPGGGVLTIEPTRALTAVDVDLGAMSGGDARQAARRMNMTAIAEAARLLRLKSLGGLIIIDLIGSSHDGAALAAAVTAASEPDQPGVAIGPVSRFGVLQYVLPRRARPVAEALVDAWGLATPETVALRLLRGLEREGRADGGARLLGLCAPEAAQAAAAYIDALTVRIGPRFALRAEPGFAPDQFEIANR